MIKSSSFYSKVFVGTHTHTHTTDQLRYMATEVVDKNPAIKTLLFCKEANN